MTLTLSFPPETEARLRERAAASGEDVETIVRRAVEEKLALPHVARQAELTHEQWSAALRAWAASHPPVTHFVDDSRESIYAGRGE
jgi:hypothetical protein